MTRLGPAGRTAASMLVAATSIGCGRLGFAVLGGDAAGDAASDSSQITCGMPIDPLLTGPSPLSVALADLDGDGHLDVVSSTTAGATVGVHFGE